MRLVYGWESLRTVTLRIVRIMAGYCMRQLRLVNSTRIATSGSQLFRSYYLHRYLAKSDWSILKVVLLHEIALSQLLDLEPLESPVACSLEFSYEFDCFDGDDVRIAVESHTDGGLVSRRRASAPVASSKGRTPCAAVPLWPNQYGQSRSHCFSALRSTLHSRLKQPRALVLTEVLAPLHHWPEDMRQNTPKPTSSPHK